MNQTITTVLKIAEWIIFIVLIGISVLVLSPFLPTKDHFSTFVVGSGSMEPKIQTGSIAVISAQNLNEINVGDVISFTSPNNMEQIIIHRVMRMNNDNTYVTRGDNNPIEDQWVVPASTIKGKLITSIPYLGFLGMYMKEPKYFAVIVGIPFLIFATLQVLKIKKGIHEEVEKRTHEAINAHKSVSGVSTINDV